MSDFVRSSGDDGGNHPQVVQSAGLDRVEQPELRLNLKLSQVEETNQGGEQQTLQAFHYEVQHGTCQLLFPRSESSRNIMVPRTLSLKLGQSSVLESGATTVPQPDSLQGNLPLTDFLLDMIGKSKKSVDKTKVSLQNNADSYAKVEEELAKLKIAYLRSIGLEDVGGSDSGNVVQEPVPTLTPNPILVDVTDTQQFTTLVPKAKSISSLNLVDTSLSQISPETGDADEKEDDEGVEESALSDNDTGATEIPLVQTLVPVPTEHSVVTTLVEEMVEQMTVEERENFPSIHDAEVPSVADVEVPVEQQEEQSIVLHEEAAPIEKRDEVPVVQQEVIDTEESSIKEKSSTISDPYQVTVSLPLKNVERQQCTIVEPKAASLHERRTSSPKSEDSAASGQKTPKRGLLIPAKHHPLFSPFSGDDENKDKVETVPVPTSAADLPGMTSRIDEVAGSMDPALPPFGGYRDENEAQTPDTPIDGLGDDEEDVGTCNFPGNPHLATSDKEELGKINVMVRKIVLLIREMDDQRQANNKRPFDAEHLDNLYEYGRTEIYKKSSYQKQQLQDFLEKRVTEFKKSNQLYIFYQALLELFRWYDESHIQELPCYLESKKNKEGNLKIVEQNIIPELDKFVEKRFTARINLYFEVQGRRYAGEPPQPGDEKIPDWRDGIESKDPYKYVKDSPNFKKQGLFTACKQMHEDNAWMTEREGFYVLFYAYLSKNSKNKPIINSDFAWFAKHERVFAVLEMKYFRAVLKIWNRNAHK